MYESTPSGCLPDRRRPGRVDDEISPERLRRYLPPRFTELVDRLPDPSSPAGRCAWRMAMRYAIWANGHGWFKSQAELRLGELVRCTTAQILAEAARGLESDARMAEEGTETPDATDAESTEDA